MQLHSYTCFVYIDIRTIAVLRADESYDNLSTAFKNVFDDINYLILNPCITISEVDYRLEFFLSADYKVCSYTVQTY